MRDKRTQQFLGARRIIMATKNIIELIIIIVAGNTLLWAIAIVSRYIWIRNWLKAHGQRVIATISSVRKGEAQSGYRYYLTARWRDPHTDKEYLFSAISLPRRFFHTRRVRPFPFLLTHTTLPGITMSMQH